MNRREFLATASTVIIAGILGLTKPQVAEAQPLTLRKIYRGTEDGKLFESTDGGKTWHLLINFGSQNAVAKVTQNRDGSLWVRLAHFGYTFDLLSTDSQIWRTV